MRKNLIRSKPQFRSLCGTLIFIGPEGCEIEVLNGPNLKNITMATMSSMLKAT
jgi:hypothetical protein